LFQRQAAVASLVLAQAAAVWIAFFLAARPDQNRPRPMASGPPIAEVVIEEGQRVLISRDERGVHVHDLPWDEGPNALIDIDPYYDILNAFEVMDSRIALAE
jgi:hypothetical protein